MESRQYQEEFRNFITWRIRDFYKGIEKWYDANSNPTLAHYYSTPSMRYFLNHYPNFWTMIGMMGRNGIEPRKMCELGSFYPYTTYYFKLLDADAEIDLYDMILRKIDDPPQPFDVDGVRFIDFNLCTDKFPKKKYDLIVLSNVMEHLPCNLFSLAGRVVEILASGGYLLVAYPLGGKGAFGYVDDFGRSDDIHDAHIREFTDSTTGLFFRELGVVDEEYIKYSGYHDRIKIVLYKKVRKNAKAKGA